MTDTNNNYAYPHPAFSGKGWVIVREWKGKEINCHPNPREWKQIRLMLEAHPEDWTTYEKEQAMGR